MSIGIVSDSDFQAELDKLSGKRTEIVPRGRKEGDVNTPESLRKIIGEESVINGRKAAVELAAEFGISKSSVSAYAVGATSTKTYDTPVKSLIGHINKSRQRAIKRASATLNTALAAITQDKLDYADASELSGIAKDMSVIIKNLEPQKEVPQDNSAPQFVIYAPSFKQENS